MFKIGIFIILMTGSLIAGCGDGGPGDLCFDDLDCEPNLICVEGECI